MRTGVLLLFVCMMLVLHLGKAEYWRCCCSQGKCLFYEWCSNMECVKTARKKLTQKHRIYPSRKNIVVTCIDGYKLQDNASVYIMNCNECTHQLTGIPPVCKRIEHQQGVIVNKTKPDDQDFTNQDDDYEHYAYLPGLPDITTTGKYLLVFLILLVVLGALLILVVVGFTIYTCRLRRQLKTRVEPIAQHIPIISTPTNVCRVNTYPRSWPRVSHARTCVNEAPEYSYISTQNITESVQYDDAVTVEFDEYSYARNCEMSLQRSTMRKKYNK